MERKSIAVAKVQRRRNAGLCGACGKAPCECKRPSPKAKKRYGEDPRLEPKTLIFESQVNGGSKLLRQSAEDFPILFHDEPSRRHLLREFDVVVMQQEAVWRSDKFQRVANFGA